MMYDYVRRRRQKSKTLPIIHRTYILLYCNASQWPFLYPIPSTLKPLVRGKNLKCSHTHTHIQYYVIYDIYVILFTCSAGKKAHASVCVVLLSHRHPRSPRRHYRVLRCTQNIISYNMICCYYYYYYRRRRRCYKSCNDNIISPRQYIYICTPSLSLQLDTYMCTAYRADHYYILSSIRDKVNLCYCVCLWASDTNEPLNPFSAMD